MGDHLSKVIARHYDNSFDNLGAGNSFIWSVSCLSELHIASTASDVFLWTQVRSRVGTSLDRTECDVQGFVRDTISRPSFLC